MLLLAGLLLAGGPAAAAQAVKLSLNFLPHGGHIGFFVAKDRGFYREAGLEVEIQKGEGSADAVVRAASGVVDFAFADLGSLVVARSRGLKLKAVAAVTDKDPSVIIALKSAGIRTPKDLEGKTIGAATGSSLRDTWPALAAANHVDMAKVRWVDMPASAYVASLLSRKVDAIATFVSSSPNYRVQARRIGEDVSILFYADFGVDTYGPGIVTTERLIRESPDLVRRFVEASLRGYAWAVGHPEEAARSFLKANPEASLERARAEEQIQADLMLTPAVARGGLGHYDERKVRRTRDLMLEARHINPNLVHLADIYTNEFVPKIYLKRAGR